MNKFAQTIAKKIQEENIEPIPAWRFYLQYTLFWILFCCSLLLAAVAISLILFYIFELGTEFTPSPLHHFLEMIPILWIISFFFFCILGYFGLKKTPKGYKIPLSFFIISNIALSFFLGFGLYALNIPEQVEEYVQNIPFHTPLEKRQELFWSSPELGRMSGVVKEIHTEKDFNFIALTVVDAKGKEWSVHITKEFFRNNSIPPIKDKNARFFSIQGKKIKIIGSMQSETVFIAHEILPWRKSRFKPCKKEECKPLPFSSEQRKEP